MAPGASFRFGPFVLDPRTFRLRSSHGEAALSPKAVDLLLMFVQQPSRLFTRDEIFRVLWPDVAVTDNALTQVVSEIRRVLGDSPTSARYLQTLARRGYRFVAPVALVRASRRAGERRSPERVATIVGAEGRSIRVLDFSNVSRDRGLAWLATGIAEALTNALRAVGGLVVIDRTTPVPGREEPPCDLVVVGAFQRLDEQLRFTARVVDSRSREAIAHATADGERTSVFALEDALARGLIESLSAALPARR
jgi:DNA-binding winged helix-turn-helix (wHTH) protein